MPVARFVLAAVLTFGSAATARAQHERHGGVEAASDLALQVEALRRATERYHDIEAARADGFRRFGKTEQPLMGEHWYRQDLVHEPLDLERPSTLIYANVGGERELMGVAYTVYHRPAEPVPQGFAGDDDVWHVHDIPALLEAPWRTARSSAGWPSAGCRVAEVRVPTAARSS
ncbi:MAG: hypothetical protein ABR599_12990 [Gemmatimonadota bacterium]